MIEPKFKPDKKDIESRVNQIKNLSSCDTEIGHENADDILCEILRECGYGSVVDEFEKLSKWYA